jgi:hypothetical protein
MHKSVKLLLSPAAEQNRRLSHAGPVLGGGVTEQAGSDDPEKDRRCERYTVPGNDGGGKQACALSSNAAIIRDCRRKKQERAAAGKAATDTEGKRSGGKYHENKAAANPRKRSGDKTIVFSRECGYNTSNKGSREGYYHGNPKAE